MTKIFLCAALLATALTPLDARADDGRPSVGISAALATGSSNDDSGRTAIPLLPLPLLDVHVPLGRFEISLEGLPPIGPVTYGSNSTGASRATKLSYGDAALRYRINRFVSVGIGETLYDQETIYTRSRAFNGTIELNGTTYPARFRESYVDPRFSRVAGGRYDVQTSSACLEEFLVRREHSANAVHACDGVFLRYDAVQHHYVRANPAGARV